MKSSQPSLEIESAPPPIWLSQCFKQFAHSQVNLFIAAAANVACATEDTARRIQTLKSDYCITDV